MKSCIIVDKKIHAKLYPARIFLCVLCNNYEVTACLYLFTKIPSIKNTAASTAEDAKLSNADTGSTATLPSAPKIPKAEKPPRINKMTETAAANFSLAIPVRMVSLRLPMNLRKIILNTQL